MSPLYGTVLALSLLVLEASATLECCNKLPYAFFTPLSKHSAAQKFCTSKYPIPQSTCLFTTTIPTTTTVVTTTNVALAAATVTVTTGQPSTVLDSQAFTPSAVIVTKTSSVSTTITSCPQAAAAAITARDANDRLAPIFSSLQKQAASFVKTLCSCIETTPGCSTSTITKRPVVKTTSTTTLTLAPKTTVSVPNTVVITQVVTVTLPTPTSTTTITESATSTYCAPPKATTCAGGVRPLTCDPSFFCTSNESCVCIKSTENDVVCADTSAIVQNCSDVVGCSSSADCSTNQMCVTNLCCSDKQCVDIKTDTCPNGQALSRLFRTRAAPKGNGKGRSNFPASSKLGGA